MPQYKLFCTLCDWAVTRPTDAELWAMYDRCPLCQGPTDGFRLGRTRFLPRPKEDA